MATQSSISGNSYVVSGINSTISIDEEENNNYETKFRESEQSNELIIETIEDGDSLRRSK